MLDQLPPLMSLTMSVRPVVMPHQGGIQACYESEVQRNPGFRGGVTLAWQIEPGGQTYSHDLMAADALRFVRERKGGPFFLYLAFTIPHVSLQVPEEALAEYDFGPETPVPQKHYSAQARPRAAYAAMVSRMDRDIGRLMAELKAQGLDKNTLVIFTSDNGVSMLHAGQRT